MNVDVLTQSHPAIAAKKRARRAQIKEVVFDDEARRSFLTGFHKRKVARREEAKKKAQLREKEERLETRREHRRALAERAARNAAEVEKAYGAHEDSDGGGWEGIANETEAMEEEYEGEEQLATVTIVQDFDMAVVPDGPPRRDRPVRELEKEKGQAAAARTRRTQTSTVKYETKAARRAERRRQRARRTEKAERAGRRRK